MSASRPPPPPPARPRRRAIATNVGSSPEPHPTEPERDDRHGVQARRGDGHVDARARVRPRDEADGARADAEEEHRCQRLEAGGGHRRRQARRERRAPSASRAPSPRSSAPGSRSAAAAASARGSAACTTAAPSTAALHARTSAAAAATAISVAPPHAIATPAQRRRGHVLAQPEARADRGRGARARGRSGAARPPRRPHPADRAGPSARRPHGGDPRRTRGGQRRAAAVAAEVTGDVHVAAFPSAERALLAPAVAALARRHPDVRVRTTELEPELSLPALRLGDADLAIAHEDTASPAPPDARLERVDLLEEPLRVVLPAGHPADAEAVALARLAGERWVATPPGTACRAMVDRACGAAGYVPDVPFQANEFSVLAAFVAAGLGVALIPEIALAAFGEGTVVRPVADVPVTRRIYVDGRRGRLERPRSARWSTRCGPSSRRRPRPPARTPAPRSSCGRSRPRPPAARARRRSRCARSRGRSPRCRRA